MSERAWQLRDGGVFFSDLELTPEDAIQVYVHLSARAGRERRRLRHPRISGQTKREQQAMYDAQNNEDRLRDLASFINKMFQELSKGEV